MTSVATAERVASRGSVWKWWVCGLLLLATMLNYMDRVTFNQTATRIIAEFKLSKEQYGLIESVFAQAFAFGALLAGWLADRYNVRWIYAAAVLLWSLAGFLTGFVQSYLELLLFRSLLGLFEAGNWPCALRTTQRILPPHERTLGNGILQSGASLGALITPIVVLFFLSRTGSWRPPFWVVGAVGTVWVVLWLVSVRREDLTLPDWDKQAQVQPGGPGLGELVRDRRFWVLAVMVVTLNATWHFFRAWLPLFLSESHHYNDQEMNWFISAYYLSADVGTLSAGAVALWLVRRGLPVHRSRGLVLLGCALLTTLSVPAAYLPRGPLLLAVLLLIGFGSLGCFPNYYSFSQELTVRHQGKVTGTLGFISWEAQVVLQYLTGVSVERNQSYTLGIVVAGFLPLIAWLVLALFWRTNETEAKA